MFVLLFILSLLNFAHAHAYAYAPQDLERLSQHDKWHKLLHYKKSWLGNVTSEADGPKFFIHHNGKHDPLEELKAAVGVFSAEKKPGNDHLICKFPLRYKWLNKELGMPWAADFSGCTKYITFFSKLAAKRASIIFSSYYLSNPNSAFGHTLLRLSRYDDKSETEILDYGINYSAEATSKNPFSYAIKGLFGGFKGKFAAIPYYYKVREYTNSEFRDLWSYDLKLDQGQVLEIVDHIWELGDTWFDYFYFKENCSYHLLSVIDVVAPGYDLTSRYPLFTIPADTVRGLKNSGLISEGKRRESTYSKLIRLSDGLSVESLDLAKKIAANPEETSKLVSGVDHQKAADTLDVAMEAFDYYNAREILSEESKAKALKEHILRARAINPVITEDRFLSALDQSESPALSHAPTRFTLAQGYEHLLGNFTRFELRTSFHDLLDSPKGSMKNSQIEMGKASVRLRENKYRDPKLSFEHFSVLSIKNFEEQNFWASPFSWEIDFGATQLRRTTCLDCPAGYLLGSIGNSINIVQKKLLLAFLLNAEANWQDEFQDGYRVGLGPKLYSRYKFSDKFMTGLELLYQWNTYRPSESFKDHQTTADWENRLHLSETLSLSWKNGALERDSKWMIRTELGLQYFY